MRTEILGVGFDDLTPEEAARRGQALVETEGFHYAVTPNPEFLLAAKKDAPFRRALLGADLVLADGVGVTYAAKILGRPLKGRVTGIGFAQGLMTWMAQTGKRLYLLGAKPGVAELAAANLKAQHPGLLVCGTNTVRLSAKEFDIMRFLLQSGSRNLSKETILARVWGYDSDAVENHVEVYVGFLRKKLASIGSDIRIEAIRRMGYHLEVNEHDKETPP